MGVCRSDHAPGNADSTTLREQNGQKNGDSILCMQPYDIVIGSASIAEICVPPHYAPLRDRLVAAKMPARLKLTVYFSMTEPALIKQLVEKVG